MCDSDCDFEAIASMIDRSCQNEIPLRIIQSVRFAKNAKNKCPRASAIDQVVKERFKLATSTDSSGKNGVAEIQCTPGFNPLVTRKPPRQGDRLRYQSIV